MPASVAERCHCHASLLVLTVSSRDRHDRDADLRQPHRDVAAAGGDLVTGEGHGRVGQGGVGGVVGSLDGPAAERQAVCTHRHPVGVPLAREDCVAEQDLSRGGSPPV